MPQNNWNNDLAIRHLLGNSITRVYRDMETNQVAVTQSITEIRGEAQNLADVIQALSDTTEENIGALEYQMQTNIEATAQLGTDILDMMQVQYADLDPLSAETVGLYQARFDAVIQATARQIVESYNYTQLIKVAAQSGLSDEITLEEYLSIMDGQIKRGYIEDPEDPNNMLFGIVISNNVSFTGQKMTNNGYTYYQIDEGQTFGYYTSTGWMFWLNGVRRGRFNSLDGYLYVDEIVVKIVHYSEYDVMVKEIAGVGKVFDIPYTGA